MQRTAEHAEFWALVNKAGPLPQDAPELGACWLWTGELKPSGQPIYHLGRRVRVPHRYAWQLAHGSLPETDMGSICWTDLCVRPDHRTIGVAWRARLRRCKHGHLLNEQNVYLRPDGKRQCRPCAARRVRDMLRARRRAARETAAVGRPGFEPETSTMPAAL